MTISQIKRIGNSNRFHVYADDTWAGVFLDETIVKHQIAKGREFDEKEFAKIKAENDSKVAFDMAVGYVEKYVVSEKGLKDYLKKKGFSPDVVKGTLDKLKEYALVDDEKFAKNYADSLLARLGKRVVAQKLRQKGVSQDIVQQVLADVDDEEEFEKAVILVRKFVKNRQKDPKIKQKCLAHLIYKGYDYSVAQKASQMAWGEGEEDDWN